MLLIIMTDPPFTDALILYTPPIHARYRRPYPVYGAYTHSLLAPLSRIRRLYKLVTGALILYMATIHTRYRRPYLVYGAYIRSGVTGDTLCITL